jgi:hypothetical protein
MEINIKNKMKKLITILIYFFFTTTYFCFGQSTPRFQKANILTSGCAAYFPNGIPAFEMTLSEDSSKVYTGEVNVDNYVFGIICVKLSEKVGSEKEDLLINYLDFLKSAFKIKGSAGYGKGHTLESCPSAVGVIDYWEDADGTKYQIKGWINESYLAVLYINGKTDYPNLNIANVFLNGFRFP